MRYQTLEALIRHHNSDMTRIRSIIINTRRPNNQNITICRKVDTPTTLIA